MNPEDFFFNGLYFKKLYRVTALLIPYYYITETMDTIYSYWKVKTETINEDKNVKVFEFHSNWTTIC